MDVSKIIIQKNQMALRMLDISQNLRELAKGVNLLKRNKDSDDASLAKTLVSIAATQVVTIGNGLRVVSEDSG